jgi:hypothetical protein
MCPCNCFVLGHYVVGHDHSLPVDRYGPDYPTFSHGTGHYVVGNMTGHHAGVHVLGHSAVVTWLATLQLVMWLATMKVFIGLATMQLAIAMAMQQMDTSLAAAVCNVAGHHADGHEPWQSSSASIGLISWCQVRPINCTGKMWPGLKNPCH